MDVEIGVQAPSSGMLDPGLRADDLALIANVPEGIQLLEKWGWSMGRCSTLILKPASFREGDAQICLRALPPAIDWLVDQLAISGASLSEA